MNKAINDVAKACQNETNNRHSPLLEKQGEMNELYSAVQLAAQDKQNQLHDILKEVLFFPCRQTSNFYVFYKVKVFTKYYIFQYVQ